MFRQIDDFLEVYGSLTAATLKVFAALTDENLEQAVAAGHRTLAGLAWHIVTSVPEMMARTGLPVSAIDPESSPPATAAAMVAGYKAVSEELVAALGENWEDETLTLTDDMYGQTWSRGVTLAALVNHEIHHRGQMTVLLRQSGATVPGIFGPAKEEWSQYGMPAPPY